MAKKKRTMYYLGVSADCKETIVTVDKNEWKRWVHDHSNCAHRKANRMIKMHLANMKKVLRGKIGNETKRFRTKQQKASMKIPRTLNKKNEAVKRQQQKEIAASKKRAEEASKHPTVRNGRGARPPKLRH